MKKSVARNALVLTACLGIPLASGVYATSANAGTITAVDTFMVGGGTPPAAAAPTAPVSPITGPSPAPTMGPSGTGAFSPTVFGPRAPAANAAAGINSPAQGTKFGDPLSADLGGSSDVRVRFRYYSVDGGGGRQQNGAGVSLSIPF